MNIAKRLKSNYEHEDFIGSYADFLLEDGQNCIDHIKEAVIKVCWDRDIPEITLSDNDAERILEYMRENPEDFIETYRNYYVGYYCVDSISFGEQEEQIEGLYNHKTDRPYNKGYLKRIFEQEDFYVTNQFGELFAYYDLSDDGVMFELKPDKIPFFVELITKYTQKQETKL